MTPPTLTSLHLLRQQLSDAHMANINKLDEAIANLSAPPPAPPAKTRVQEIAAGWVRMHNPTQIEMGRNGDAQLWDVPEYCNQTAMIEKARSLLEHLLDAELARCEQEKQAALATQQERIAKWLENQQYRRSACHIRNNDWKTPTTE